MEKQDPAVEFAFDADDLLGEGPVWSATEQALYWVDIKYPRVRRWTPATGEQAAWSVPEEIGSMALRVQGGMVLALQHGFATLDLEDGTVTTLHDPEPDQAGNRFNDGKCDAQGRFWAGTMDEEEKVASGSLYRLDADLESQRIVEGVICSNGLGWSPDGGLMYYTDTRTHRIDVFDFDAATGDIANRRTFAEIPADHGVPDGLTVDAEGALWVACWGGWRVIRFAPDGLVDREVMMPVPQPTSCTFGGPSLSRLYVTSAKVGLDQAVLERAPKSGCIFAIDTETRGQGDHHFAG